MNKTLIAPISIMIVFALKQYFNLEFTQSDVEQALNFLIVVGSGIWAGFTHPKTQAITTQEVTTNVPNQTSDNTEPSTDTVQ